MRFPFSCLIVFATRELIDVIRYVSLFRGHLHLLALRTSFRPSRFFFSPPTTPFSQRYHANTGIFKPRWSNQHGHREEVLDQFVGPTRPRS